MSAVDFFINKMIMRQVQFIYIIMEEIRILIEERMNKIKQMNTRIHQLRQFKAAEQQMRKLKYKQAKLKFKDEQKMRIQKENWLINILKSIKGFSVDKKKQFILESKKVMDMFVIFGENSLVNLENLQECFVEYFSNLYVYFFAIISQMTEFKFNVQQIIRPNNRTIITDLIKCLIDFTREKYKSALSNFKMQNEEVIMERLITQPQSFKKEIIRVAKQRMSPTKKQKQKQKEKQKEEFLIEQEGDLKQKQKEKEKQTQAIKFQTNDEVLDIDENYKIKIQHRNMKLNEIQDRVNQCFLNLKQRNHKIKYLMQQWRNQVYGENTKNLMYNYQNLYTQRQIQELQRKRQLQKNNVLSSKKLTDNQLKNFWKSYVQSEIQLQKLIKTDKPKQINKNLNFYIKLRYDQQFPLEVLPIQVPKPITKLKMHSKSTQKHNAINYKISITERYKKLQTEQQTREKKQQKKDKKDGLEKLQSVNNEKLKLPKLKSDLVLPYIHNKINGVQTNRQKNSTQLFNYLSKSARTQNKQTEISDLPKYKSKLLYQAMYVSDKPRPK